jgi:(E)-4-hydroxy-3-methylbut-2-enyl-diphosphate synthase
MSYRPYQKIERRKSRLIHVGRVPVGGDSPITVQTMTNTLTSDASATIDQIRRAEEAGTFADFAPAGAVAERQAEETAAWTDVVKRVGIKPD